MSSGITASISNVPLASVIAEPTNCGVEWISASAFAPTGSPVPVSITLSPGW